MMRWVIMRSGVPMWQDRHSSARFTGSSVGYRPFARLSACELFLSACDEIHCSAPPWQASQPMPSLIWKRSPRCAAGTFSAWQSRQTFACVASPMPSFLAIERPRSLLSAWNALFACGSNSCQ